MTGGGIFGIFGKATTKYGRDPIVLLGFVVHALSYFLVFLNIPDDSVFGDTYSEVGGRDCLMLGSDRTPTKLYTFIVAGTEGTFST